MEIRTQIRRCFKLLGLQRCIRPLNFAQNKLLMMPRMTLKKAKMPQTIIFYLAPNIGHPGLADRFKAILGCYEVALKNHMDFKIVFNFPFPLCEYLSPNEVDWCCKEENLRFSIANSRFFDYKGELETLRRNLQYVCINYVGILPPPQTVAII